MSLLVKAVAKGGRLGILKLTYIKHRDSLTVYLNTFFPDDGPIRPEICSSSMFLDLLL